MAKTFSGNLKLQISGSVTNSDALHTVKDSQSVKWDDALTDGTAVDNADQLYHQVVSLTAATQDVDLASLTDKLGDAIPMEEVAMIAIKNVNTTSGQTLTVGGAAASAFSAFVASTTDKVVIGPNGFLTLWNPTDGYAVNTASANLLRLDPGTNTVTAHLILFGRSA